MYCVMLALFDVLQQSCLLLRMVAALLFHGNRTSTTCTVADDYRQSFSPTSLTCQALYQVMSLTTALPFAFV